MPLPQCTCIACSNTQGSNNPCPFCDGHHWETYLLLDSELDRYWPAAPIIDYVLYGNHDRVNVCTTCGATVMA